MCGSVTLFDTTSQIAFYSPQRPSNETIAASPSSRRLAGPDATDPVAPPDRRLVSLTRRTASSNSPRWANRKGNPAALHCSCHGNPLHQPQGASPRFSVISLPLPAIVQRDDCGILGLPASSRTKCRRDVCPAAERCLKSLRTGIKRCIVSAETRDRMPRHCQ
jgi:hypothetical protein